jgi:adenosylhomocysteinase
VAANLGRYDVKDLALAPGGVARIEWAEREMPVLRAIRDRFGRERPFAGQRLSVCLHVTAESANLLRALEAGGADLVCCAADSLTTQDDVAAALVSEYGIPAFCRHGEDADTYYAHIDAAIDHRPQLAMDDGADVIGVLHARRREQLGDILGATEGAATGVMRLRALEEDGKLAFPVIAVDRAQTARLFENRFGTGQSTVDAILRATNVLLSGRRFVVAGYGWCGRGVAARASGMGAQVIVTEVDPLRALEARLDGYEVMPMGQAAAVADIVVTATGGKDVVARQHLERMQDGTILANAGHFNVELDLSALRSLAASVRSVRPGVDEYTLEGGRRIYLLADGRVVNLTVAEGQPAAVLDMSLASHALAAEHVVVRAHELERHVYGVPDEIDREVARLKLESMGVTIEPMTPEQKAYSESYESGT